MNIVHNDIGGPSGSTCRTCALPQTVVVAHKRYSVGLLFDGCVKSPDYRENIHRVSRSEMP